MITEVQNESSFPELTALDRCDGCSARAMHRVVNFSTMGELLFCGHHFHRNEEALLFQGFEVV